MENEKWRMENAKCVSSHFADTTEFHVCIPPRRGSPMPAQANGLGNGDTKTTEPQRGDPSRMQMSAAPSGLYYLWVSLTQADGLG